jgi:hypothetical protein
LLVHRPLGDERLGKKIQGTVEESGTPSEDVGTKKGKEVPQKKHPRIEEVIQEPQNKKQKHGDSPSSPIQTPRVQEI